MSQGTSANYWLETVTPLAANGTFTSTARDSYGAGQSGNLYAAQSQWAYFAAVTYADQTGTVMIQGSQTATGPWYNVSSGSLVANTPLYIYTPVCFQFFQVVVTNGSTQQTKLNLSTAFTNV